MNSYSVLLVEDDDAVRDFVGRCLRAAAFKVVSAGSAEEALELFPGVKDEIHLLLTDMVMPGLFGDELAARLAAQKPDLKIIFMSGNTPASLEPGVVLREGINFLRKPFSIQQLKGALAAQLPTAIPPKD